MLYSTSEDNGIWLTDDIDGLFIIPADSAESFDIDVFPPDDG